MRLNRGCGCILLVLAVLNLVFVIAAIIGFATGETSTGYAVLGLLMFGANLVAASLLGIAAFRGRAIGAGVSAEEPQHEAQFSSGDEGEGRDEESGDE